ncbi:MAG TPA: hypothetical protein VMU20_14360 [Candidatus Dormibacteraeota bacterium]|jgi:hypothetical protein|nr:hypothetical protein [Candidatus Dormibacteraeota bacterium]
MGLGVLRIIGLAIALTGFAMLVFPEVTRRLLLGAGIRWEPDPQRRVASWLLVLLGLTIVVLGRLVR